MGGCASRQEKWAALQLELLPEWLRQRTLTLRQQHGPLPGFEVPPATALDPCPLCGHGEAGSAHLMAWCPAVALAWRVARPKQTRTTLLGTVLDADSHCDIVVHFLHQVVCRHAIGVRQPRLTADEGCRAVLAGPTALPGEDERMQDEPDREDHLFYRLSDVDGARERMRDPCPGCAPGLPQDAAAHGSAWPAQTRNGEIGGDAMRRNLVSAHAAGPEAFENL